MQEKAKVALRGKALTANSQLLLCRIRQLLVELELPIHRLSPFAFRLLRLLDYLLSPLKRVKYPRKRTDTLR